jgi:tRNA (guanine37-N1)-methyltransferase
MRFDIITIFPEMLAGFFSGGVARKALEKGLLAVFVHDLRDYAHDKHRQVDDRPFGGGEGMVLKPEPIFEAVEAVRKNKRSRVFLLSPQGTKLDSALARKLSKVPQVILICGRYEGVDERVVRCLVDGEISIGDYVLTGGEPAAWVVMDAVSRFIPGVVGKVESVRRDSPRDFRAMKVPQVLFSGNHAKISDWRRREALEKTRGARPDLLANKKPAPGSRKRVESARKKGTDHEPD